ncbi:MAG: YifB family Mg chelatase-like AAA ATPase [Clostridia bacterium]|nr:YifB family Mg chelatase-like AAA ATPase [Clostridia bacterium]
MYAKVTSLALSGFDAIPVEVEADVSVGLPRFDLVGLPGSSVSESRERVRAAIRNCGLEFPISRITVNLAPADVRKEGPVFDLPILAALLSATRQISADFTDTILIGEISLSGEVRRVKGVLPMLIAAREQGFRTAFIPAGNRAEATVVDGLTVFPAADLPQLVRHWDGTEPISPVPHLPFEQGLPPAEDALDFADVRGQELPKMALEIAAAGGHNLLMTGPPGSGKSMLARRLPTILPALSYDEALETTKLYSVAGRLPEETALLRTRPFRAPHHSATLAAMTGGGKQIGPGEVSLSTNGVLFLDELPHFSKSVLESLRQPLEDGQVTISRARGSVTYPSRFMLVCAMNPCPCGHFGDPNHPCTCSAAARQTYRNRVSGPLLDRIDLLVKVSPLPEQELFAASRGEPSAAIRERVTAARAVQQARFADAGVACNAQMTAEQTAAFCRLTPEAEDLFRQAYRTLRFSARSRDRILRTARTIADLDGAADIRPGDLAAALQFRFLEDPAGQ